VTPSLANFLFEAVNFALLAAALGWILFKPVRQALARERERQSMSEQEQARLHSEAQALLEEARVSRAHADQESDKQRDEILAAARTEAARMLDDARRNQATERRTFEQELAARLAGEATALAGTVARIVGESIVELLASLEGPDLDAALTRAACAELKGLSDSDRTSILVESAHPLTPEVRSLLVGAIGPSFQERVVAELVAGVRVTTPAGQIDATALAISRQAAGAITAGAFEADRLRAGRVDD
jgi:F0F1-type ATP synthase membrane subunit b/b'